MAASSFVNETCHSYFADLKHVNSRLEWNPYPRDRGEAMQELWWDWIDRRDKDMVSGSVRRYHREHALEDAKRCAEQYARPLANYYGGRIILDAEDPGNMPPTIHSGSPEQNITDWSMKNLRRRIIIGLVGQ